MPIRSPAISLSRPLCIPTSKSRRDLGFHAGPFELADRIGLDVPRDIGATMREGHGERFALSRAVALLYTEGRCGTRQGAGFYRLTKAVNG